MSAAKTSNRKSPQANMAPDGQHTPLPTKDCKGHYVGAGPGKVLAKYSPCEKCDPKPAAKRTRKKA
jgi:hypothetical protein